jgi:HSP20 family protein
MEPEAAPSRLTANVYDSPGGETYIIEIPVPGLDPGEISIEVESTSLTVRTNPRNEAEPDRHYLQREQTSVPMSRVFEFPMEVDTDSVRAMLDSGILKIEVPKAAAARPRVIRVNSATGGSASGGSGSPESSGSAGAGSGSSTAGSSGSGPASSRSAASGSSASGSSGSASSGSGSRTGS